MERTVLFQYDGANTVYGIFRRPSDGYAWDVSAASWVPWNAANIGSYDIPSTDAGGNLQTVTVPTGIALDTLIAVLFFEQQAGAPAAGDLVYSLGHQVGLAPGTAASTATGTATYDLTSSVGQVRLLIMDTDTSDAVFSDAEISVFLALESDSVRLGAATALEAIASEKGRLAVFLRTLNYEKDSKETVKDILAIAQRLRDLEEDAPAYGVAEVAQTAFSVVDIIVNRWIREAA